MNETFKPTSPPSVVTHEVWLEARKQLLTKEKQLTRLHDQICAERRALPWVKVEKDYVFDSIDGSKTLSDLFDGRSQLFVYHFMLPPDADHICDGCSFLADHVDAARQHFEHADLSFVAISRAKVSRIEEVKKRLGWKFRWVSSFENSFNYDYKVSFTPEQIASGHTDYNFSTTDYAYADLPGSSIFAKDTEGTVYHTYSSYSRGGEVLLGAMNFLDMTPKGRNETDIMSWVELHDEYSNDAVGTDTKSCCCKGSES